MSTTTDAVTAFAWLAAGVVGGLLLYKGAQVLFDEDFGTVEFPVPFRREIINRHIALNGHWCDGCGHPTARSDFQVDHIVALANGGRTSRANARVICRWCNAEKGARNSMFDYFVGRAL